MFETKVVAFTPSNTRLDTLRQMTKDEFIEYHGSGTLRKNTRLGMANHEHYLQERIAYEFGREFRVGYATRILVWKAISEGDNKWNTELWWHAERYINTRVFDEDKCQVAYISYENAEWEIVEGNWIVLLETSFQLPPWRCVFAIVQEYDRARDERKSAVNPF